MMFPKVVQVIPMENYSVYIYFEDGKIVCYDMIQMIEKEVFRPSPKPMCFGDFVCILYNVKACFEPTA